jgi:hypothetical protein
MTLIADQVRQRQGEEAGPAAKVDDDVTSFHKGRQDALRVVNQATQRDGEPARMLGRADVMAVRSI